jgi:hypothetical protein
VISKLGLRRVVRCKCTRVAVQLQEARIFGTIRDDDLDAVQGFFRSLGLFDQMTGRDFFGVKSNQVVKG